MEIQHKTKGEKLEITQAEWRQMQANGLSRNYRVINSTDREMVRRLSEPPVEVIDFLKETKSVVMADNDTEQGESFTVKKRKVRGGKAVDGEVNKGVVARAGSVEATDLPEPALTYQPIELAHEEPIQTFDSINFTDNQIVS